MRNLLELPRCCAGVSAFEYSLIATLIGATAIFAISVTGGESGSTADVAQNKVVSENSAT